MTEVKGVGGWRILLHERIGIVSVEKDTKTLLRVGLIKKIATLDRQGC